jgi:hypothetical protein
MSDIVERLRRYAAGLLETQRGSLCAEAADEIEGLRAALADTARPEISPWWVPRSFHEAMLKNARGSGQK